MKEIQIETKNSLEAGEDGGMYWDAVFIPELSVVLQVTAMDKSDFAVAVEKFKQDNNI
jgi:hypothetical protein